MESQFPPQAYQRFSVRRRKPRKLLNVGHEDSAAAINLAIMASKAGTGAGSAGKGKGRAQTKKAKKAAKKSGGSRRGKKRSAASIASSEEDSEDNEDNEEEEDSEASDSSGKASKASRASKSKGKSKGQAKKGKRVGKVVIDEDYMPSTSEVDSEGEDELQSIQRMWKVPSMAQLLWAFSPKDTGLKLRDFSVRELELSLVDPMRQESILDEIMSHLLVDNVAVIKTAFTRPASWWNPRLRDTLDRWFTEYHKLRAIVHSIPIPGHEHEPIPERDPTDAEVADEEVWRSLLKPLGDANPLAHADFWELPLRLRVDVLYTLLDFNTASWQPLGQTLRSYSKKQLRLESLGVDKQGRDIYCLDMLRDPHVYAQSRTAKGKPHQLRVLCHSLPQLEQLYAAMRASKHAGERRIAKGLLPPLEVFRERHAQRQRTDDRKRKLQLMAALPRRSSARVRKSAKEQAQAQQAAVADDSNLDAALQESAAQAKKDFEEQLVDGNLFKRNRSSELRDAFVTPGQRGPALDAARAAIRQSREAADRSAKAKRAMEQRRLQEEMERRQHELQGRINEIEKEAQLAARNARLEMRELGIVTSEERHAQAEAAATQVRERYAKEWGIVVPALQAARDAAAAEEKRLAEEAARREAAAAAERAERERQQALERQRARERQRAEERAERDRARRARQAQREYSDAYGAGYGAAAGRAVRGRKRAREEVQGGEGEEEEVVLPPPVPGAVRPRSRRKAAAMARKVVAAAIQVEKAPEAAYLKMARQEEEENGPRSYYHQQQQYQGEAVARVAAVASRAAAPASRRSTQRGQQVQMQAGYGGMSRAQAHAAYQAQLRAQAEAQALFDRQQAQAQAHARVQQAQYERAEADRMNALARQRAMQADQQQQQQRAMQAEQQQRAMQVEQQRAMQAEQQQRAMQMAYFQQMQQQYFQAQQQQQAMQAQGMAGHHAAAPPSAAAGSGQGAGVMRGPPGLMVSAAPYYPAGMAPGPGPASATPPAPVSGAPPGLPYPAGTFPQHHPQAPHHGLHAGSIMKPA